MLAVAPLLMLALPASPPQCQYGIQFDATGTVGNVQQPLPSPFAAVAPGDAVELHFGFAGDVLCTTASMLNGWIADVACCQLTIAGQTAPVSLSADPCLWGERYVSGVGIDFVEASAPLDAGQLTVRMEITDAAGTVGIGLTDIAARTIDVAAVVDPGFDVSLVLMDPAGVVVATIDVGRMEAISFGYGGSYCMASPNSTGNPALMFLSGSPFLASNDLTLGAVNLPPSSFLMFLTSRTRASIPGIPSSAGTLCVGGMIGRFVGPGQIQPTGTGDMVQLLIDNTALPTPTGLVAATSGEVWYFTAWYRDVIGATTNNFTNGVEVTFF